MPTGATAPWRAKLCSGDSRGACIKRQWADLEGCLFIAVSAVVDVGGLTLLLGDLDCWVIWTGWDIGSQSRKLYGYGDALFCDPVNWRLIEDRWRDLMRVVISIRESKLSLVTLLRRLRHDSKKNKIYRVFRELGRVVCTMVLLRYISPPSLRRHISKADLVMVNTVIDMSTVINQLQAEGHPLCRADLATMWPYQQDNVRRFGDFAYDLTTSQL
jgi:hypothetical protein